MLVTDRCAAYCRYCTRSRLVSNASGYDFHPDFERQIAYVAAHPEIRDVLLSGGDPLLLVMISWIIYWGVFGRSRTWSLSGSVRAFRCSCRSASRRSCVPAFAGITHCSSASIPIIPAS